MKNRGCDYSAEIMRILVDPTFRDVDAHRVISIIKSGAAHDNSAHEILVADVVKGVSRSFRTPEAAGLMWERRWIRLLRYKRLLGR